MPIFLCEDEKVLKSWTFASDDTSVCKKNYSLTVTNKRIISTTTAPQSIERTELSLNSIKGITGSYSANKQEQSNPKRGLIALGLLLLFGGIILIAALHFEIFAIIMGAFMAMGGLVLTIYGASKSTTVITYAGFKLNITTYGQETSSMSVGKKFASTDTQTQTINVTHITIYEAVAREIIDTLGALVLGKTDLISPQSVEPQADEGLYDEVVATTENQPTLSKENE